MGENRLVDPKKVKECPVCGRTMRANTNFYTSSRLDRFPDEGYLDKCKKCFTMHIDIDDPATILPLLEDIDIPYIPVEWKNIAVRYRNNPKTTTTAIFGRYVAMMKLIQYKKYSYEDTAQFFDAEKMKELNQQVAHLKEKHKYQDALESGKVAENLKDIDLNKLDVKELKELFQSPDELFGGDIDHNNEFDITPEDKNYLLTRWGKNFKINDCIKMEKLYNEMIDSYDVRTGSHKDYLLKICRTSLKMDQALEINDIDGFQKLSKTYDLLMKSAKFTASQTKDLGEDNLDALGVAISMAETKGFLPKFYDKERQDIVDYTIQDIKRYLDKLVRNEANLGNMIEIYLQKMVDSENQIEGEITDEDDDIIMLSKEEENDLLLDQDYEDFNEMLDEESAQDLEKLIKESGENV